MNTYIFPIKMNNNSPLKVLIIGMSLLALIILGSQPDLQNNLAKLLNLDPQIIKKNSTKGVEKVKVSRVVDGDTIELIDGRTVRYLNIDTPETKKPGTPVQCFGLEASSFNKKLVDGQEIEIKPDKENEDGYGRMLRFIFLKGSNNQKVEESLNAKMVNEGYARSMIIKPNTTYQNIFKDLEKEAKNKKLGIWGNCDKPFEG